ncbi:MAG: hypothetical protein NXI12_14555 [Alphaproteobacteria bacterium]|nr:hypothetical protein [Alphaproteobacteria bacterium]
MAWACRKSTAPFWGGLGAVTAAALASALTAPASAGAWTREKGDGLAILGLSIHQLLPAEGYEAFNRLKGELSVYGEYGWNDRLTLVGRAAWQSMQITTPQTETIGFSVPVKPALDPGRDDPGADHDGDGVSNRDDPPSEPLPVFERRSKTRTFLPPPETGVGGLEAGVRYRLLQRERAVVSAQAMIGLPGNGENWNNLRFGEGGVSADLRLEAGRSFGRSTFINASAGMRLVAGSRPDEMRLDLTAGTHVTRGVRVMAQTYSVWSVGDGVSGLDGYSGHRAQVSVLWPIDTDRRAQISALATFSRANMSQETALIASVWRTF